MTQRLGLAQTTEASASAYQPCLTLTCLFLKKKSETKSRVDSLTLLTLKPKGPKPSLTLNSEPLKSEDSLDSSPLPLAGRCKPKALLPLLVPDWCAISLFLPPSPPVLLSSCFSSMPFAVCRHHLPVCRLEEHRSDAHFLAGCQAQAALLCSVFYIAADKVRVSLISLITF